MKIDHATLDRAINFYSVALGRPGWLDPAVNDLQHDAWNQFIDAHEHTPGKLIIADFAAAIRHLLNGTSAGQSPNGVPIPPKMAASIVPPMVIDGAVAFAFARYERVRLSVEQHDKFWLYAENRRLHDAIERARSAASVEAMNAEVAAAKAQYDIDVDEARADLINSGYGIDVITAKMALIDARRIEVLAIIGQDPPRFIDPADRPALPSLDEMRELERVWRAENE